MLKMIQGFLYPIFLVLFCVILSCLIADRMNYKSDKNIDFSMPTRDFSRGD